MGSDFEAAKKEGKVNVYMYRYGKVLDVFRSDYPEIRPFLLTGSGAQIITKIMAERRAGRNLADVIDQALRTIESSHLQAKMLEPDLSRALMLPEVTDESRWFGGKHRYLDPDGRVRLRLPGQRKLCAALLQHDSDKPEASSVLTLRSVEAQNGTARLSPWIRRSKTEMGGTMQFLYYNPELVRIHQTILRQQSNHFQPRCASNDRLARPREVCNLFRLFRRAQGEESGLPIEIFEHQSMERGGTFGGARHALASGTNLSSERGKSLHQLVSLAQRPDGVAEAWRSGRASPIPLARIFPRMRYFRNINSWQADVTLTLRSLNSKI